MILGSSASPRGSQADLGRIVSVRPGAKFSDSAGANGILARLFNAATPHLYPKESGDVRPGGWGCVCLLLGRLHSPGPEALRQGSPAPAAIALRADLVPGGHAVFVFVC